MGKAQSTPPPRKTAAVTIAGAMLLLPAALHVFMAIGFATDFGPGISPYDFVLPVVVSLISAAFFSCAGSATIRRWRGWRIWAGTAAWGLIVLAVMPVFSTPPPPGTPASFNLVLSLVIIAFAVFLLVAKRRERRPNLAPVFD